MLTLNLWGIGGDWARRRTVLGDGLKRLALDLIAFQEVYKTDERDTAAEVLAPNYHLVHRTTGLLGDGNCAAIASRWPIGKLYELDQQLASRTAGFPATTLIVEIDVPKPVGPLLFVNHAVVETAARARG